MKNRLFFDQKIMIDIVVVIMVKNEELKIVDTLQPFVDNGYKNFVIYDTGSTDNTVSKVTEYLEKSNVKFHIKIDEFRPCDEYKYFPFSVYRNKTLDYTRQVYKNSEIKYMVMIDCEWYIVGADKLLKFVEMNIDPSNSFKFDIHEGKQIHNQRRLFKISGNSFFTGTIHESVEEAGDNHVPHDIYFNMIQSGYGNEKTKVRHQGDIIELNSLFEKTGNPRWLFYLGQTYGNLWDDENTIKAYERRIELDGDIREKYVACYRLAGYYAKTDWNKALATYLKAYQFCPKRIEVLVKLAQHYHGKDAHMKYMFAKQACSVDFINDGCFIEEGMYKFTRWEQLSIAAWDMCYYANCNNRDEVLNEGYKAALIARREGGEMAHLIRNVSLFESALGLKSDISNVNKCDLNKSNLSNGEIINLILYSEEKPCYIQMRKLLSSYLKSRDIEHYFYCFRETQNEDFILDDDILYIKGKETYIPGILDKTLLALKYISTKSFKYVVRSNVSSFVNFNMLKELLDKDVFDYGGTIQYGFNQIGINNGDIFIGGQCLIFSKPFVNLMIENKDKIMSYNRIDDQSIGLFYIDNCKNTVKRHLYGSEYFEWNSNEFKHTKFLYRNRQDDIRNNSGSIEDIERNNDVSNMCSLILKSNRYYNSELNQLYNEACQTKSDINEHVPVHYELAKQCNSVMEIGVRNMVSTWGLLKGLSESKEKAKYIGIDLFSPPHENMVKAKRVCQDHNIDFNFIVEDDLKVDTDKIGMVDMIFLDALHQYGQVTQELEKYAPLSRKYFTFHDTSAPWGNVDEPLYGVEPFVLPDWVDKTKRGVWPAVEDFLIRHPEWSLKERKLNNHGFTILERKQVKVIDCFTFYNELEMLKYRLMTLNDSIDYFVLVESTKTHKGNNKRLYYDENKSLFDKYNHKIIHIIVDDMPEGNKYNDVWNRERHQRRCITRGIVKLNLDKSDIIIVSDLDEIINPITLIDIKNKGLNEVKSLNQDLYYYNLTCKEEAIWSMPKICNYGSYYNPDQMRLTATKNHIDNGGWHLSFFGDIEFIINKLSEFSHQEFNNNLVKDHKRIEECIKNSIGLFPNSNYKYIALSENGNLPPGYNFFTDKKEEKEEKEKLQLSNVLKEENTKKKICKHIAFFYIHDRLKYVNMMIDEVNNYDDETDIYIHTNINININLFLTNNKGKLIVVVHDLKDENPFYLTWKPRKLMEEQKDDYDIFIYVEDDILIFKSTIEYWKELNEECISRNHNLGFLRIEYDNQGEEYLTDINSKLKSGILINDKSYIVNDVSPYCAFWVYSKHEFKRFVDSKYYNPQNIEGYEIRESSAIGLHGLKTPWYTSTVIPFKDMKIDPRCKVWHMPNNYVKSGSSWGTGEIRFSDLCDSDNITLDN